MPYYVGVNADGSRCHGDDGDYLRALGAIEVYEVPAGARADGFRASMGGGDLAGLDTLAAARAREDARAALHERARRRVVIRELLAMADEARAEGRLAEAESCEREAASLQA